MWKVILKVEVAMGSVISMKRKTYLLWDLIPLIPLWLILPLVLVVSCLLTGYMKHSNSTTWWVTFKCSCCTVCRFVVATVFTGTAEQQAVGAYTSHELDTAIEETGVLRKMVLQMQQTLQTSKSAQSQIHSDKEENPNTTKTAGDSSSHDMKEAIMLPTSAQVRKRSADVILFAGRMEPQSTCCKVWVYAYFLTVLILATCLSIVVFWDNALYSKTFSCSDLNPEDANYACFDIHSGEYVDCLRFVSLEEEPEVVCYQFQGAAFFRGLGIAVGVFHVIPFTIKVVFPIVIAAASHNSRLAYLLQIIVVVIAVTVFAIWPATSKTVPALLAFNLFQGELPLRWIMYALTVITVLFGIAALPWQAFV